MKRLLCVLTVLGIAAGARAQPANNDCANAIAVTNHSVTVFDSTAATLDGTYCGAALRDLWYSYTAAGPEIVTVTQCGGPTRARLGAFASCGGASLACSATAFCGAGQPKITFVTPAAGTYLIGVAITSNVSGAVGTLTIDATPNPLPNDDCAGATTVADGDNQVSNVNATQDTQITCVAGGAPNSGADTWYTYTAPGTGVRNFEVTTFGGTGSLILDSTLAIFDGCGGALLACDDNGGVRSGSKIYHFPVTTGTIYKIRFSGTGSLQAPGTLRIASPQIPQAGDDCALATALNGQGVVPFNTAGLTNSDTQAWDCEAMLRDGWVAWTPSASGMGVVSACGATGGNNLNLSIYDSCGAAPLLCASNFTDEPIPFCAPKLAYGVESGRTYYVRYGMSVNGSQASGGVTFEVRAPSTAYAAPSGALPESGNCEDAPAADLNGGCDVTPNAFTPLNLCEVRSGTASSRLLPLITSVDPVILSVDFDWYQFTLQADQVVTILGQSEFPPQARIVFGCPAAQIAAVPTGNPNTSGVYSLNLTTNVLVAGTYYYVIAPQGKFFNGVSSSSCGHGDRYWFTITGSEPCPPANDRCCRGTTCNSIAAGSCTGMVAGSVSLVVGSCGAGASLASCCYADFNHDGTQSIDDLFLYFNAYFTGSPWANFGGDGVEQPTIDDLFLYINAYFTGCS